MYIKKLTLIVSIFVFTGIHNLAFSSVSEELQEDTPKQVTHIPATISDVAKGTFAFYNSLGFKLFSNMPSVNDFEAWTAKKIEIVANTQSLNDQVLAEFEPEITPYTISDVPVVDIKPKNWCDNGGVVVFLHGGGYTVNDAENYLLGAVPLSDKSGMRVISIDYTTAPFAHFEQIINQVIHVLQGLSEQGYAANKVALYGDSAGGGLAMGSILKMRDQGMELPSAIALWSPWLDASGEGDTWYTMNKHDPIIDAPSLAICAEAYAGVDTKNPYVSPVYADLSLAKGKLPPILIQGGTKEMFMSDFVRFNRALLRSGQDVTLDLYEGMTHVFQVFGWAMPESVEAIEMTSNFFKKYIQS